MRQASSIGACLTRFLHSKTRRLMGAQPKDLLTVLSDTNVIGTKKTPLFEIGKATQPHCFCQVKHLPRDYRLNKKSWMTSVLCGKWVRKLEWKMASSSREILLPINDCLAHPIIQGLLAVHNVLLPPNTHSVVQPCNQGML